MEDLGIRFTCCLLAGEALGMMDPLPYLLIHIVSVNENIHTVERAEEDRETSVMVVLFNKIKSILFDSATDTSLDTTSAKDEERLTSLSTEYS